MPGRPNRKHRVDSVYVNGIPVWECRHCGRRWLSGTSYLKIESQDCEPS